MVKNYDGSSVKISPLDFIHLDQIFDQFDINSAKRIKEIEKITNHDVKAIEYFLKEKLD